MALQQGQIIAIKQPIDLLCRQFNTVQRQVQGPPKPRFVYPLHPQDKAIAFPAYQLDEGSVRIAEHE